MNNYKQLADAVALAATLCKEWKPLEGFDETKLAEAAAILRSLDAKPAGRVLIDDGGVHINPYIRDADAAGLTHGQEVYAAPVAAQPPQAKPDPLSADHPLAVFAQECAIGAHEYGGLRLAAQNALKAAGIKEQG